MWGGYTTSPRSGCSLPPNLKGRRCNVSQKKHQSPVLEEKVAIDTKGILVVETPQADLGFLQMEIGGEDAGRIVFDRRKGKLKLMFNQTVFAVGSGESKKTRNLNLEVRGEICRKLGGIDVNKEQ
jgi:hypothetical protein